MGQALLQPSDPLSPSSINRPHRNGNGIANGGGKQQPLLANDENGQQQTYSDAPLQRLWRPANRTGPPIGQWSGGKRRKRLVRLAALAGTLTLGLGLLLLLWLLLFLSGVGKGKLVEEAKKQQQFPTFHPLLLSLLPCATTVSEEGHLRSRVFLLLREWPAADIFRRAAATSSYSSENGQQQTYSDAPLQRLWRPANRTGPPIGQWSGGKRRKRLVRLAALAGTLTLGLGLLLLLWLLLFLSGVGKGKLVEEAKKQQQFPTSSLPNRTSTTTIPSTNPSTTSVVSASTPSSFNSTSIPTLTSTSTVTPTTTTTTTASPPQQTKPYSRAQKLRLSLIKAEASTRRPFLLHRKPGQEHQQQQNNVIRVTAPARPIQFDRMEMKQEEKGKPIARVRAHLDKGGEWGQPAEEENGSYASSTLALEVTPTMTGMTTNGSNLASSKLDGVMEDVDEKKADKGIEFTSPMTSTTARPSQQQSSRTREEAEGDENEEDDDVLFWMPSNRPRLPSPSADGWHLPSMATTEKANVTHHHQTKMEANSTEEVEEEEEELMAPSIGTDLLLTEVVGTTTDGYELKRPTIEFGPVRAEDERGEGGNDQQQMATVTSDDDRAAEVDLEQELNDIIASVEREPARSRSPPPGSLEIRPVEIPFDPVVSMQAPPVPVWRRPPPDESEEASMAPPPPPPSRPPFLPISNANNFSLQTSGRNRQLKGKNLAKERQTLWRRRREAPVLVTALLDIGRGQWQRFTRHFDQYLGYLANIMFRLQNNIVLFCDPSVVAYLRSLGNQVDWQRIQIVEISLSDLPFYKHRPEIADIMRWEQANWQGHWDQQMRAHPETLYPDYDILVNSKPYFLYNATKTSMFPRPVGRSEQFYAWIDAGYGHGSREAIPMGVWSPQLRAGQITMVKLPSQVERVERFTLDKVYRKQRSVVSGGFLAGDERVIHRFLAFFTKTFLELLDQRKVDDDQTTLLVTIQRYNSTFNLLRGGWFDAFKLLSSSHSNFSSLNASSSSSYSSQTSSTLKLPSHR